jgi:glycosyltransferase involved in cell wall biosynthesis
MSDIPAEPNLSVVLANYNHGGFLQECLEAILAQSRPADEILVVDDGSTDDSLDVLAVLAVKHPLIQVIRNQQNMGVPYSQERGLSLCSGQYLFFPAVDDRILPGMFEKSMAILEQHPEAAFSMGLTQGSGKVLMLVPDLD